MWLTTRMFGSKNHPNEFSCFWDLQLAPRSLICSKESHTDWVKLRKSWNQNDDIWYVAIVYRWSMELQTHRIHGTSIFTYIYHPNQPNVGNIPYTDAMGKQHIAKQQLVIHTFEIRRLAFSKMAYECDNHNPRCQGSHNFWHFEKNMGGPKTNTHNRMRS